MILKKSLKIILFFPFLLSISHSCVKNESNSIVEVKIVCFTPIVKSGGNPIPEKLGELFLPFGECDKTWLRINPTFFRFDKMDQTYVPNLLGKTFAGNMNNKKLVDRMINRGLIESKIPSFLTEKNFNIETSSIKIEKDLKGHLKKAYYILYSTKPMDEDKTNGFKIHFESESVLNEINKYWCENKEKGLPITILINPPIIQSVEEHYESYGDNDELNENKKLIETSKKLTDGVNEFAVYRIPFNPDLSKQIYLVRNQTPDNLNQFLSSLEQEGNQKIESRFFKKTGQYVAITGGMYEEKDKLPPGLIIENGKITKPLNLKRGKGNFYDPSPNGVFYIGKNDAGITEASFFQNTSDISFAIQTGPMLISNNNINPRFEVTSNNRYARTAIGLSNKGGKKILVFVTSKSLVNFHEIANFMKIQQGCEDALHLESINAYMCYPGFKYPVTEQKIMNLFVIR